MLNKEGKNQRLRTFLEKAYNQPLSGAEVLEYKNRLVNFFSLLIEIDQRNKRKNNETKTNWNPNHTN